MSEVDAVDSSVCPNMCNVVFWLGIEALRRAPRPDGMDIMSLGFANRDDTGFTMTYTVFAYTFE